MNIHPTGAESFVCENWNSGNPSMVSFAGHESNTQKQFWDWETNHNNNNNSSNRNHGNPPYIINPTTNNIFDRNCNNTLTSYSSSPPFASSFPTNLIPYSQFAHYSSTDLLKREEEDNFGGVDGGSNSYVSGGRIGLNLGHRTYFSSQETAVIDRLFRRPRGFYQTHQVPKCQAEGCRTDLSNAKHYHRRHKVCEFHSKATKVVAAGLEQRFCQQCSRFHLLSEFDEAKRSCRKRLADHNRRRRKPQTGSSDSSVPAKPAENAFPQMGSSVSKSEIMEKTRTFTGDSTSSVKETVTNGPDLSLGGEQDHQISYSVAAAAAAAAAAATHQRSFIFNNNNNNNSYSSSSTALFQRENSFSSYNNLFMSTSNEASQSTGGVSEQTQHPEDMQNLLHLGQAMFGVELL